MNILVVLLFTVLLAVSFSPNSFKDHIAAQDLAASTVQVTEDGIVVSQAFTTEAARDLATLAYTEAAGNLKEKHLQ